MAEATDKPRIEKTLGLPNREELTVAVEHGDQYGGLPGIEIFVCTNPDGDERETRLPTKAEIGQHGQWITDQLLPNLPD